MKSVIKENSLLKKLDFLNVDKMKHFFIFFICFTFHLTFASPVIDTIYIKSSDSLLRLETTEKTIHFFCRVDATQKEIDYLKKFDLFLKKKEIQKINNLRINLIFYRDANTRDKNIGLKVSFPEKDTVLNDFSVFFQNFNKIDLLNTYKRTEISKVYILKHIANSNLTEIKIAEVFCADLLADNIIQYKDFISQLYNPVFSEKEEIEFLKDSLRSYKKQFDLITEKIIEQNERLLNLEKAISIAIENQSNNKNSNRNKGQEDSKKQIVKEDE